MKRSSFKSKWVKPARVLPAVPDSPPKPRATMQRSANEPILACPKGIKARPGKRTPTVLEAKWMDSIVEYGCVACKQDIPGAPTRPAAVHHIVVGGRRLGHLFTLPLCDPGHHQGGYALGLVSRHPWKARFEAKYGSELELLAKLKTELGVFDQAEYAL